MKSCQRKLAMERRRALSERQRKEMSTAVCQRILALPELERAETVFSYLAAWDEVELDYVNRALTACGVTVAYPVCLGQGHMEAYVPESDNALEDGAYGIKSPIISCSRLIAPSEIDVVLVPCVAFDGELNRLGHGAGYYDRFLTRCGKAISIAAAFDMQRLEQVHTDQHDIKMDIIVTESAVLR